MSCANLHLWKDRIVWASTEQFGDETRRPAIAVLIGVSGPVRLDVDGMRHASRVLAVAPGVPRSLDAPHGFYSLNLDPVHVAYRYLRDEVFANAPLLDLEAQLTPALREQVAAAVAGRHGCAEAYRLSERLIGTLFPDSFGLQPIDPRIDLTATWLRTHLPARIDLSQLAAISGLSASRLSHLFSEQLGVSPRSYLLWVKMRRAVQLFSQGSRLTDIAHDMGFSDSAHLNRTFQNYFSVPPSLLADPERVRLTVCDAL